MTTDYKLLDEALAALPKTTTERVVNIRNGLPLGAVLISRRTKWGNPYIIGKHGDRVEVLTKYRRFLVDDIMSHTITLDNLASLHGKVLACHCAPLPCHGHILAIAATWAHNSILTLKAHLSPWERPGEPVCVRTRTGRGRN